jgi:hypothetical protein
VGHKAGLDLLDYLIIEKFLVLSGIQTPDLPACSLVMEFAESGKITEK